MMKFRVGAESAEVSALRFSLAIEKSCSTVRCTTKDRDYIALVVTFR